MWVHKGDHQQANTSAGPHLVHRLSLIHVVRCPDTPWVILICCSELFFFLLFAFSTVYVVSACQHLLDKLPQVDYSEVLWPSIWWLQQNSTPCLWVFCWRVVRADSCFCASVLSSLVSRHFSLSMPFTTNERVVVSLLILTPVTCWFQEWGSPGSDGRVERRMTAAM